MALEKIGIIIQARMKSTRLPGKVLLPLPFDKGKPMLQWIVEGLQKVAFHKEIVVATSTDAEDQAIEDFCLTKNILCYRGSETDVLSRYLHLTEKSDYSHVIRYTADNPFVDTTIVNQALAHHLSEGADHTATSGLPLGVHVEIINRESLLGLKDKNLTALDREHVTLYLKENKVYKKSLFIPPQSDPELEKLRLTVDYPSDFLVASSILNLRESDDGMDLIKRIYQEYPWIFEANRSNFHKNPANSLTEEITEARRVLKLLDMDRAANLLQN